MGSGLCRCQHVSCCSRLCASALHCSIHRSGQQVVSTVQAKLRPTLLANWTVWPLAHVINFALVPPAQRILYINVVNVGLGRLGALLCVCASVCFAFVHVCMCLRLGVCVSGSMFCH